MFSLVLLALADGAVDVYGDKAAARAAAWTAARTAAHLAARHGAAFAALAVSGPLGREGGCVLQLPGEQVQAARRAEVEALLREVMPLGLTADVMHAAGFVHVEALKAARILGPDLLVLGASDGAERCRNELFDCAACSAALIAAAAPCPVLMVPAEAPPADGPYERALVAVDLAEDAVRCRALLDFAARLAAREGAELSVVHALPLPLADIPSEDMARRVEAARQSLAYFCNGPPGADRFRLIAGEGAPGIEILKHARERGAELLVLGVGADGGGVVLARVLSGSRCPVLLVGPAALACARKTAANARPVRPAEEEDDACPSMS